MRGLNVEASPKDVSITVGCESKAFFTKSDTSKLDHLTLARRLRTFVEGSGGAGE